MRSLDLTLWCFLGMVQLAGSNLDRAIRVLNESGGNVELHWVNPAREETVLMTNPSLVDGAVFTLSSYVGHKFQVREVPDEKSGVCNSPDLTCRVNHFVVSDSGEQVVRVNVGIDIEFSDSETIAQEEAESMISRCQRSAYRMMENSAGSVDSSLEAIETLASCVEKGVARKLEESNKEIAFQARIRTGMAELLENYTCVDSQSQASPNIKESHWDDNDGIIRTVNVKHSRPASKIHVIDNFINDDECDAMEAAARPSLHHATVADGKGGSRLSENRKAMQAGIKVPWHLEASGDAIARISRRVYNYTNYVLGLGIKENGQEDLMSIQYFGRGRNDTSPDRYTPHCDGDCTGLPHKPGTRMATMVMYCTLPSHGGATNFRNAGIHVRPVKGSAVFFSYIDPVTMVMDTGFTEHSGCPVYEGSKKIVTQWIRYGVDDENPWNSFNTLGIKVSDAEDQ